MEITFKTVCKNKKTDAIIVAPVQALGDDWEVVANCLYIGLKDKDGKEIFVGDKVLFEACDWEVRFGFHKVILIEGSNMWQYAYGFYLWSDFLKAEEPIDKNTMGDSEFIGSIYGENPTRNVYGEKEKSN